MKSHRRLFIALPAGLSPYTLGLAALGLLAFTLRLLPGERMIDDAYITFRYARNLLAGVGLVYNPGERVFGSTTPTYTLLLAGLAGLLRTSNFPALSTVINAVADAASCVIIIPLGARLSGQPAVGWAAGALWAVAPMSVTFAIGGMETSVFILLMLATFTAYLRGRVHHAAVFAALSVLTRPDALIFIGPIAIGLLVGSWQVRRNAGGTGRPAALQPRLLPSALAWFLLVLLPWVTFATLYYGTPITNSVSAKSVGYQLPPTQAIVRLWQHYSTPFFEHRLVEWLPGSLGLYWPLPGILLYLSLYALGVLSFARRDPRSLPLSVYPLLYLITFAVANPLIFRWYLAPPLPMYFLGILGGAAQVFGDLAAALNARQPSAVSARSSAPLARPPTTYAARGLLACSAAWLCLSLNAWTLHPDHGPDRPAPEMAWFELELLYEQVGRDLALQDRPNTVIAAGDIGALGYYSGAQILDTLGLISPQAQAYYPLDPDQLVIAYAVSADLVHDLGPDYLVVLEVYGRNTVLRDPRFQAAYALVKRIDTTIYGSDGMLVFRKNSAR